jgi:hypothetical protein
LDTNKICLEKYVIDIQDFVDNIFNKIQKKRLK